MSATDPKRDDNSIGNLLLRARVITWKQLQKALADAEMAKSLGDKKFRVGDALVRMGVKRELIEQVARHQVGEKAAEGESTTHITAQMAASNIESTKKVTAMAEAIALATPKTEPKP